GRIHVRSRGLRRMHHRSEFSESEGGRVGTLRAKLSNLSCALSSSETALCGHDLNHVSGASPAVPLFPAHEETWPTHRSASAPRPWRCHTVPGFCHTVFAGCR